MRKGCLVQTFWLHRQTVKMLLVPLRVGAWLTAGNILIHVFYEYVNISLLIILIK